MTIRYLPVTGRSCLAGTGIRCSSRTLSLTGHRPRIQGTRNDRAALEETSPHHLSPPAVGDLFLGPYSACSVLNEPMQPRRKPSRLSPRIFIGRRPQARRYVAPSRASRLDGAAQPRLELRMP